MFNQISIAKFKSESQILFNCCHYKLTETFKPIIKQMYNQAFHIYLQFKRAIGARIYQGKLNLDSKRKRGCKEYKNGTQAMSPKASIKPKPS